MELERMQLYTCGNVATVRRVVSIFAKLDKNKHADKSDWSTDFDGACGECATAKYYNRFWPMYIVFPGVNDAGDYKKLDVDGYQVRATPHHDGCLIIRPNDKDGEKYILAITSDLPNVRLVGSFGSTEAKQKEFWRADKNSWWVPQDVLWDLPPINPRRRMF